MGACPDSSTSSISVFFKPGQVVFATNNDIQNEEIPGISDIMKFDGGLTSTGENFVEDLSGTTLPNDQYSFAVRIYQVDEVGRRELLANETIRWW